MFASAADLKFLQQSRRGSFRNFKSKSGTRIIDLLVPLCFRSSCQRGPPCITNFGSGALELHDDLAEHPAAFEALETAPEVGETDLRVDHWAQPRLHLGQRIADIAHRGAERTDDAIL